MQIQSYPILATRMIGLGHGNAYRAWALARAIGRERGMLGLLKGPLLRGYDPRWIRAAVDLGILMPGKGETIAWLGLPKVCALFEVEDPGNPFDIEHSKFVASKWKAHVYEGALININRTGNPIARQTIERLTGVPKSSQIRYEKQLGMDVTAQFAVGKEPPPDIPYWRAGKNRYEWQRPNVYEPKANLNFSKARNEIVAGGRPRSGGRTYARINFTDYREANKALVSMYRGDSPFREVYTRLDSGLWEQNR